MWETNNNGLERTFIFSNFVEAFAFITKVALLAESQQHHPEWSNVWNMVKIRLSTHDEGNIVTEKDINLAKSIDELLN
jgi:4a-hydroxytetrahydrobiopterin dehydratase